MLNIIKNLITERVKKYKFEYIKLICIGILVDLYVRYSAFSYDVSKESSYSDFRKNVFKITNGCFKKTNNEIFKNISDFVKGENYVVQYSKEKNKQFKRSCITTTWNFIHFLLHLVITFFFPFFYIEIFMGSFIYEIYEYFWYKCHDLTDVLYNITGIFCGYKLKKIYEKYV
jgi:hypothetical protein